MFLIYVLSVFIKHTFMEDVVLKETLDKNVAAIGLVFSFALAACDAHVQPESAAYCYENTHALLLSGALGVDGQGKERGVFIAHYQMSLEAALFFLADYEVNQSSLTVNNRRVRELCDRIKRGEKVKLLGPNQ